MTRQIQIVGGGLAGLTLGIALRQLSVPVCVHEAGDYPRHRVCGEFIHGEGLARLEELGLMSELERAGAIQAESIAFFNSNGWSLQDRLPSPARALSRFHFDSCLAGAFTSRGGELRLRNRVHLQGPGIVHATGRKPVSREGGFRWIGLKAHLRNLELASDLEMHLGPEAYLGLCRLSEGGVNLCGLFRQARGASMPAAWKEWLLKQFHPLLASRLRAAEWIPGSECAVAGLSLRPRAPDPGEGCRIGDALTMIAPITGNGMSMAIESGCLAAEPLSRYARGETGWGEALAEISQRCRQAFFHRLQWAWRIQRALFSRPGRSLLIGWLRVHPGGWRQLMSRTR